MMHPNSVETLKRLSKGKLALSVESLLEFCRDVAAASDAEIIEAVAKKPKASKSAPKPIWLQEMEKSRKKLSWSAAESARKLIEIAADEGFIDQDFFTGKKTAPTFPAAAKQIAAKVGGDRLAVAFTREVNRLEREFRLG